VKGIKIGEHIIPLWLIVILSISGIAAVVIANYAWNRLIIPFEVKDPIEILYYPSELSLFPGETEEFNMTIQNYASANYYVILDFHLSNTTYQDNYVTFSNETYTVIPGQQNLSAWLRVEPNAPPINTSLTIDLSMSERTMKFQTIDKGYYSGHKSPAYYVINDAEEWADVWDQHTQTFSPQPPSPEVDFSRTTIIAVFMGEYNTGGYEIEIKEMVDTGPTVVVKVEKTYPGKGCIVTMALSQPYHIVEVDKIDKQVVFETSERTIECD
jgi:hypothetical protein